MACDTSIRDDLISRLAHQPQYIMNGMIKISNPATPSTITRSSNPTAALGQLNKLPLELLHFTFSMLDLKTLSSISRTCLRGLAVVESTPEFCDLMRHAPSTMTALGSTGLAQHHTTYTLHTALLSSKCASCGEFGPFLFLPTCDRCCYGCLWSNASFWVAPIAQARSCFELSAASIKKLSTMLSLPGTYRVLHEISRRRRLRLVSVKAAKRCALDEGKTVAALSRDLALKRTSGDRNFYTFKRMQNAPLAPPGPILAKQRLGVPCIPNDLSYSMASIPFPSLQVKGELDGGLWCLGCERVDRDDSSSRPYKISARLRAEGYDHSWALYRMTQIARSKKEFFEHISECEGAKELVPGLEEKLRQMTLA